MTAREQPRGTCCTSVGPLREDRGQQPHRRLEGPIRARVRSWISPSTGTSGTNIAQKTRSAAPAPGMRAHELGGHADVTANGGRHHEIEYAPRWAWNAADRSASGWSNTDVRGASVSADRR